MKRCPKCSSCMIIGPRYAVTESGAEKLIYVCGGCGYQTATDTHDRKADIMDDITKSVAQGVADQMKRQKEQS